MAQSLDEIAAVLEEVRPLLVGGRIQKVFQPGPHTVTLEIRAAGKTLTLLLSADPETARVHMVRRRPPNPPIPLPFCQYLRAQTAGARIERVEQMAQDRVVRIGLLTRHGPRALVLEVTGRQADLLFVDEDETVRAALNAGRTRAGQPYRAPARRPAPGSLPSDERHLQPPSAPQASLAVSAALEETYGRQEEAQRLARMKAARQQELRRSLKKARRRIEAAQADLDTAARYREDARYGDLLKGNLGHLSKGQREAVVVDYFDPRLPELVIPLDPVKSPRANMEEFFKRHRKYLSAQKELVPRLAMLQGDLMRLEQELLVVQQEGWRPPAAAAPAIAGRAERTRRGTGRSGPFRRCTSVDGLPIYVGRNAGENEEVTFRLAHSDDIWLHARGVPGSHVVVRVGRGADIPPETLRDAANLALLYSDLKKSGKGEVIYTRRKYVRKIKGQPPGTVAVTQEKALFIQLDRNRLERLKSSQDRAPGAF